MERKSDFFESNISKKRVILEADRKATTEFYSEQLSDIQKFLDDKERLFNQAEKRLKRLKALGDAAEQSELKKAEDDYRKALSERNNIEDEYYKARAMLEDAANSYTQKQAEKAYAKLSKQEQRKYDASIALKLKERAERQKFDLDATNAAISAKEKEIEQLQGADKQKAQKELDDLKKQQQAKEQIFNSTVEQSKQASKRAGSRFNTQQRFEDARASYKSAKSNVQDAKNKFNEKFAEKELEWQKKIDAAKKAGNQAEVKRIQEERANIIANSEESKQLKQAEAKLEKQNHELAVASLKELAKETQDSLKQAASKALNKVGASIDANLDAMFGQQGKMMGRLQGSAIDWAETVDNVSDTIGFSGIVSKKSMVAKMIELVDSGVAYNLELRAFLAETSENIAATFDAFDSNLLRIIRLQQSDSTAARLGMEASLTKLFNKYFEDTSYLSSNGGVSDTVSGTILDTSATMGKEESLQFEFTVQKWLGSLYSLGLSSEAVSTIAKGINLLGTGNVSEFNNSSDLQMLLTMSTASSGGKSLTQLLNEGLNSEETNKLLKSMIEYLADIASSQTNMVTKSAYAQMLGMSVTDLNTFANITTEEINSLYKTSVTYNQLLGETEYQLSQISNRMSLSKLVDTALDNAEVGAAETIGSNAFTYGTWKALGVLKDYVGEIKIPSVLAAGFGLSSDIDLINLAQTALAGFGLVGSLVGAVGSMNNGGPASLSAWDASEIVERGGLQLSDTDTNKSYSLKLGVGSASGEDVQDAALQSGKDTAYESADTTEEEQKAAAEEAANMPRYIYELLGGDAASETIYSVLEEINTRLDPSRVFYTAIAGVLSTDTVSRVTNLATQIASVQNNVTSEQIEKTPGTTLSSSNSAIAENIGGVDNLSTVIANAIRAALSELTTSERVPVEITNWPTAGGI